MQSARVMQMSDAMNDAKFKEKLTCGFKYGWGIWWIFTQPLKSLKNSFPWALFVQSIRGLSYKNREKLSFMTLKSDAKFE